MAGGRRLKCVEPGMLRSARVRLLVLPLVAVLVSACTSSEEARVVTGPSLSDGYVPVTDTFSGTLLYGGTNLHTFHTMPGLVTVTLVSVDPADAPAILVAIGMWDGISCQMVFQQPVATASTVLIGTASMDSNVCIKVSDPATLAEDASVKYQLTAVHNEKPKT
jgi:hypothetical protein